MSTETSLYDAFNTQLKSGINLIEASAGTGKTFTLAMLVVRFILEKNYPIQSIVIVTYTKMATEELKGRIRERLYELQHAFKQPEACSDITIQQWLNQLEIDVETLSFRLNNALQDLDQANIYTIHGFCQRILKEHTIKTQQYFDAELQTDIKPVIVSCAQDFWRKQIYPRNTQETSLLTHRYNTPETLLESIGFTEKPVELAPNITDLEDTLANCLQKLKQHSDLLKNALKQIHTAIQQKRFNTTYTKSFPSRKQALINWLEDEPALFPGLEFLSSDHLISNLNQRGLENPDKLKDKDEIKRNYLGSLTLELETLDDLNSLIHQVDLAFRGSLFKYLKKAVKNEKSRKKILTYDDQINQLATSLKNDKDGQLTQNINSTYQVALIDEFQDTDADQWLIFSSLFQNNYLYLIGDPKQAIYKFRGADIHSYFLARKHANYHYTLATNWRSHPDLVAAINQLFSSDQIFQSDDLHYEPAIAGKTHEAGYIESQQDSISTLHICHQSPEESQKYCKKGSASQNILKAICTEITRLLNEKYTIHRKQNNAEYSKTAIQADDIAILVSTHETAKQYKTALNQLNVRTIIKSNQSIFSSDEAQEILSLLKSIAEPENIMRLKQTLTAQWFFATAGDYQKAFDDEEYISALLNRFQEYKNEWHQSGVFSMLQSLKKKEKILQKMARLNQPHQRITNWQHCIEMLEHASSEQNMSLHKTLNWFEKQISLARQQPKARMDEHQTRIESDEAAIYIITLHSSKGLEFPIVFCPDLWSIKPEISTKNNYLQYFYQNKTRLDLGSTDFEQGKAILNIEARQENMRLLYVALTRAVYRCYLYWADFRTAKSPNQSPLSSLFQFQQQNFAEQQVTLQALAKKKPKLFSYQCLEAQPASAQSYETLPTKKLNAIKFSRILETNWQMSSYSALAAQSKDIETELPNDKAQESETLNNATQPGLELPPGALTGNVIHEILQLASFESLSIKQQNTDLIEKCCKKYGLANDHIDQLNNLLMKTVNSPLQLDQPLRLADLQESQCLKEMPFYLALQPSQLEKINQILSDCPTYRPLNEKQISGFLTGFIDLIYEHNNQYYVIDYKSNSLNNYEFESIETSMKDHNYGLQYWLYSLVLHRYLKQRLTNYDYKQHMGGVQYLYVRGMTPELPGLGVYTTLPEEEKIQQLENLLID